MKRKLTMSLLSLVLVLGFSNVSQAKICFSDAFGYTWQFDGLTATGGYVFYAEGTVDAYPGGRATLWLDLSGGLRNGQVHLTASWATDGCSTYSDSFVYVGSATIIRIGGTTESYTGSGTWASYCFGGVLNVGTWQAAGPCGSLKKQNVKGPLPATGSKKLQPGKPGFSLNVFPNPVKSIAQLGYKVSTPGNVNITVYNYLHQPVKVLVNEYKSAGNYSVTWNALSSAGTKVQPGLYKVVSTAGDKTYSSTIQVLH